MKELEQSVQRMHELFLDKLGRGMPSWRMCLDREIVNFRKMTSEWDDADGEIERLRAALRPFAEYAQNLRREEWARDHDWSIFTIGIGPRDLFLSDCERASEALEQ